MDSAEKMKPFQLSDVSENLPAHLLAPIDRLTETIPVSPEQAQWVMSGTVFLDNFIPKEIIKRYCDLWEAENKNSPGGWASCTPYMSRPEIRDLGLYPPLMKMLKHILTEDAGMHLNLTGWVSTERNYHQDTYLNPPHVGSYYAAVWIALKDIHPDSGPFQYVPGSHRWPTVRRDLLLKYAPEAWKNDHRWPKLTEEAVSTAFQAEIKKRSAPVITYLPKAGDVLIWHSGLVHRGSEPVRRGMRRPVFIAHYSGLGHRQDMPNRAEHTPGCHYFVLPGDTPVR